MKQLYPRHRWIVGLILLLGLAGANILWFAPSPLLPVIIDDLHINLMQAGLAMSVVCLLIAVMGIVNGPLLDKFGPKKVFAAGLWLMGAGASATYLVINYPTLFVARAVTGIGIGLALPVTGALIMMWFPENERPFINTVNSVLPYVATAATFTMTVPLYLKLHGSWRLTLTLMGIYMVTVAMIWMVWGKERNRPEMLHHGPKQKGVLKNLLTNREVLLLSVAEAADMWSFQFLTSYLPTYYTAEQGMSIADASNITAVFPVAGIIAGILCGVWMSRIGRRKPFTWPLHLVTFTGTLLAINGTGIIRLIGVSMAGFGNAGWAPALFTMPMEFADMTPVKVGIVYSVVLSSGFLAAFVSPWIGGWLGQIIGLHDTIFAFSFASLLAAACTFLMKETGPVIKHRHKSVMGSL